MRQLVTLPERQEEERRGTGRKLVTG